MKSSTPRDPTRTQILVYLKRRGRASVRELAAELGVTPMAVRRHLLQLENAHWVTPKLERRARGRPAYVYLLTPDGDSQFPRSYDQLALDLLRELRHRKVQLVERHAPRFQGRTSLEERVAEMAQILTEAGYMADWRKVDDQTYTISEHNCAVFEAAKECPSVCACELSMMRTLVGAHIKRTDHMVRGNCQCLYVIKPQAPSRPTVAKA
jgi:predicted ArsR family transcriptional regulator